MTYEPSSHNDFETATNRRTHARQKLPKDLRARADEVDRKAEHDNARIREDQARNWTKDLNEERKKFMGKTPVKTYENSPWRMSKIGYDRDDIVRLATQALMQKNETALHDIDQRRDERIDETYDSDGTLYRGHDSHANDKGRERR